MLTFCIKNVFVRGACLLWAGADEEGTLSIIVFFHRILEHLYSNHNRKKMISTSRYHS